MEKFIRNVWFAVLGFAAVALCAMVFGSFRLVGDGVDPAVVFLVVAVIAFFCEYIDSSLGMGFGTILTPVLLILGFTPLQVVPVLLMSETLSGILGGVLHHGLGNVDFRAGTDARRIMLVLAGFSILGTLTAVAVAIQIPAFWVKLYIGAMIVAISVFLLWRRVAPGAFAWWKIVALAVVSAFNKGISGGGYGPLVTGGQVVLGVEEKRAIGTTTLSEGLVCLVGLVAYLIGREGELAWDLALPVVLGAMASVPMAAWTVRILPPDLLRPAMGWATLFLGLLLLIKLFV